MQVSVIVCTHNPRQAYLERTLKSIAAQSFGESASECLLVDNHSSPPIRERGFELPGNGRLVEEPEPGLTPARMRGIAEAQGEWLIFVDDDNVLDPDYLANALNIIQSFPQMGVFGGRISPEFEVEPPAYIEPFRSNLALADFDRNKWSNQRDFAVFPCGAGMVMRKDLALAWAERVQSDAVRRSMGRKGKSTASGEDTDMILTALEQSYGVGRFTDLHLTHLIPKERLDFEYQKRLAYGTGYSAGRLNAHQFGVKRLRRLIFALKAGFGLLNPKVSCAVKRIGLSGNYGYWRGLGARSFSGDE